MSEARQPGATYLEAIRCALEDALISDDRILLGEDIGPMGGAFGVTEGLHKRFGGIGRRTSFPRRRGLRAGRAEARVG